ncbi:Alpha/beta hydrolase family-domain-containing protein [Jimgerdemannia flammicorona]|uniref:Alpha/beta hydrolase family-domain-containing protein n=1 Tax=Jimgerdemannia flammicorona TaxID=994334 RepID=A0A433DII7_9FUNG|nr:Alpha/beta hydrolase family-domain-containing protein [Jimgerdemannia flammicorona]
MSTIIPTSTYVIPVSPETHRSTEQKLVVNRYVDPAAKGNSTICFLFCHANGYHKELWHPIMRRLRDNSRDKDRYDLELWAFDCRNQGDSAIVNEDVLDDYFSWNDYARDALQVVDACNVKLGAVALVGVGHSFGGTALVLAESLRPGTFTSLVSVDPVLFPDFMRPYFPRMNPLAAASKKRRQLWASHDAALASFLQKPFYQRWDPEMVAIYARDGLRRVPSSLTEEVTLKCTRDQEQVTFTYDQDSFYDAFNALPSLAAPVWFMFADKSEVITPQMGELIASRPPVASAVFLRDTGHLVPMEKPDEVVRVIERAVRTDVVGRLGTLLETDGRQDVRAKL